MVGTVPAHLVAGLVVLEEVLHVDLNFHLLGDVGLEELDNLLWRVTLSAHLVTKLSSCGLLSHDKENLPVKGVFGSKEYRRML